MSGTMRVAVYYNNHDVRIEERAIPRIGPRELLVKVHASGICGSDVLEWYRVPKAPLVLGHEIAAEIVEVGGEVKGFGRGDHVFVSHHVPCLECAYCQGGHETVCRTLRTTNLDPGGFAEFVRVPEINVRHGVFRLPENLSWEHGVFVEPLACAVRGQRAADVRPGRRTCSRRTCLRIGETPPKPPVRTRCSAPTRTLPLNSGKRTTAGSRTG